MSRNNTTTLYAVWWAGRAPKWAPLENRSTNTNIIVKPWDDGSPMMKSRDKSSHMWEGIGRGCSRPAAFFVSYFVCSHKGHCTMYWRTSSCICGQSKFYRKWWRVFDTPVWSSRGEEWNSSKSKAVKGVGKGIQIWPCRNIRSLWMVRSEWASGHNLMLCRRSTYWGSCNKVWPWLVTLWFYLVRVTWQTHCVVCLFMYS